jgi:hypothetical protein
MLLLEAKLEAAALKFIPKKHQNIRSHCQPTGTS